MGLAYNNDKPTDILIVDDVTANISILVQMLRKSGYGIRAVTSVKQAIQAIGMAMPHLILLDISMPEIDGFEFCKMLKNDIKTREIPIIFISAMNASEDKVKGFKLGAVDFITKPFEIEEVTVRVNTHLKIYRMNQETEIYNKRLRMLVKEQRLKMLLEHKNLVQAVVKFIVYDNELLKKHVDAVGKNARLLSIGLQLSPMFGEVITDDFVDVIEPAVKLHDIGRLAIKQSELIEMNELNRHAIKGSELLRDILDENGENEYIKMAADIVYCQHERWDGCGVPNGIKGDEIPLSARIFSVINKYDNLRKGINCNEYSHKEAIDIIINESGKSYDPNIIEVLKKIHKQLKD